MEMRGHKEITSAETEEAPPEVAALGDIQLLPYVLAAIAGGGAAAGLFHGLYAARRRNRRQFAVLGAIGFTRGARTVMAIALVIPALAVGVPVGLGVGRLVWYEVAVASGVGGDVPVPAGWLIVIAAATLLAVAVAAIVGRPHSSEPAGSALRVE